MDGLSYLGLIVSFGAIFAGQLLEGGEISSLLNVSAFLIVLGGTIGAVMLQTPWPVFKRALRIIPWVFHPPALDFEERRNQLILLVRRSRQFGLLSLEDQIQGESDSLMRTGLDLIVSGMPKRTIKNILESKIEQKEYLNSQAVHVYESMGGYSPTIGILGAVLGLIHVMGQLTQPGELGAGIAVAFVATIYGVGLANLLFLPIAHKLGNCMLRLYEYDCMIMEGLLSIASGESPGMLTLKLENFGKNMSGAVLDPVLSSDIKSEK